MDFLKRRKANVNYFGVRQDVHIIDQTFLRADVGVEMRELVCLYRYSKLFEECSLTQFMGFLRDGISCFIGCY